MHIYKYINRQDKRLHIVALVYIISAESITANLQENTISESINQTINTAMDKTKD